MNIKLNLKKFLSLKGTALALALTLSTTALTGCSKKAECNITNPHAHLYTSEQGYIRYIDKEYLSYEGFTRNEESICIEGEEELYRLLDKIHDKIPNVLKKDWVLNILSLCLIGGFVCFLIR